MPPELVLTVSQLLIQARSWLLAERLMFDAIKKWPSRNTLRQRYGRNPHSIGTPESSSTLLEARADCRYIKRGQPVFVWFGKLANDTQNGRHRTGSA